MLTYSKNAWIEIQQKMVDAGLNEVPHGKLSLSVTRRMQSRDHAHQASWEFFDLNFETEEDELMFLMRWA